MHRYPRELSGGQRQRVAMGRAIVRDPKVFLFDEPLSNLDAKLRVAMRAEIKALHQRLKTTTVYVTHDQVEAMTMADRIAVMNDGRIEQLGAPLELYDRPANLFVAQFIGSPAMNVFEGVFRNTCGGGLGRTLAVAIRRANEGQSVKYGIRPEHFDVGDGRHRGRGGGGRADGRGDRDGAAGRRPVAHHRHPRPRAGTGRATRSRIPPQARSTRTCSTPPAACGCSRTARS